MDTHTTPFDSRINRPAPHIVAIIAEIDGIRGEFKAGLRMTPQAIISLKRSVLVTSAGASTRIEGAQLTDIEVEKILQGLTISTFADRDSQEVQGYLETLQNVFNGFHALTLGEGTITALHSELLKYSEKDQLHKGAYKTGENTVGILGPDGTIAKIMFNPTPAWQTPAAMAELVAWTRAALEEKHFHPLLVIANCIVEFLKIHPFQDGNGRLSRVLTNLLLLRTGYVFTHYVSHEQIIERRKDEYYLALRKSQETFGTEHDTIEPWLNFFFSVLKEQARAALTYLEEEHVEDTLSPKQYLVWQHFMNVNNASPAEIAKATGIIMPTVRKAIIRLAALKKIKRTGQGAGTRYIKI